MPIVTVVAAPASNQGLVTRVGTPFGGAGAPGRPGASAYELAVQNGFTGTLAEWLASLQGPPGADGAGAGAGNMYLRWLLSLQYDAPGTAAHGAIRWHDSVATRVAGVDYWRVEPYFASLAVYYALEADPAAARNFALGWINWWAARRNPATHTALVAYINADGSHVATALPGADPVVPPDAEDATDSNLALWMLALARYISLFGAAGLLDGWQQHLQQVFDYAYSPAVRDAADHMTWATPTYPIKYLMDNTEVWAGVDAASALFALLGDTARREQARAWADALRARTVADMWDSATGLWAVHKDGAGSVQRADLANAYPDALAQVWPAIFGLDTVRGGYSTVAERWPGWTFGDVATAGGSADAALALAAAYAGRPLDARRWLLASAAKQTAEGGFPYPFLCANAAMAAVAAARGLGGPAGGATTVIVDPNGQPLRVIDGGDFSAPTADSVIVDGGLF